MSQSTQARDSASVSEDRPSGWLVFAAVMMFGLGTFALMAFLADILNSSWLMDSTLFGARLDWFWYGFFDGLVALGSFYAGYAILTKRGAGFVIGLLFATLSTARWFLLILRAPIWSITMVVLWCLVIYALTRVEDYPI